MLTNLKIENVAVIEKAQVEFSGGLNVLTGETGAGKSILIGSLNAILGNRISRDLVRTGEKKACIWATFEGLSERTRQQLEKAGYEAGDALLLYREINADGKGSCRINGMPATAAFVRDITQNLINIHGQHDSQGLTNPAQHMALLDSFAQNRAEHEAYYRVYRQLVTAKKQLDSLSIDAAEKQRRIERLQFQLDEIDAAQLHEGEEEALTARRQVVQHSQGILSGLSQAQAILGGSDEADGAADQLGSAAGLLEGAAQLDGTLAEQNEKIHDLYYSARELAEELSDLLDGYQFNPTELDDIEERLDTIYRLKQKYGQSEAEILEFAEKARQELEAIENSDAEREKMSAETHRLYKQARELAEVLTQTRLTAFEAMNRQITEALVFLNMPGIRFALVHSRGTLTSYGQDSIEFYISANPGEEPKPLAKIASGGELSRIMLAIKSALADKDSIPTIIYDEIDTGVSGLAAGRIGRKLKQTSVGRQILCITHTAQIAALADRHLLIQKHIQENRTYTEIEPLDREGRIREVARIISGDHLSEISLANAREMIDDA